MKARLLLGLLLAGLLCGCASSSPYSETMTDTDTQSQQSVLPEGPRRPPPTYRPGLDSGPGYMGPGSF
jgi:hypothetical protein